MTTTEPEGRSSPTGADPEGSHPEGSHTARSPKGARSKLRRRVSGILALSIALLSAGGLYTAFAPRPQTAQAQEDPALVRQGEQLYNNACITCHGANLQGVPDRGPSLIGTGEAA
ncbi:MAG TPA: cytochrome c, partial [Pseudonocardiaceae bacterium]|nr:cytochrome c [Pseudonocardiaceae bacterium]